MKLKTSIIPAFYADTLRARVSEQADATRDPREAYEVIACQDNAFAVRVRAGMWAERDLVFEGTVTDGTVSGDFRYGSGEPTENATRFARVLARLTGHLFLGGVVYLAALGLFSLLGGKGALLPLIAPVILWTVRAVSYAIRRAGARRRFLTFLKNELDTVPAEE